MKHHTFARWQKITHDKGTHYGKGSIKKIQRSMNGITAPFCKRFRSSTACSAIKNTRNCSIKFSAMKKKIREVASRPKQKILLVAYRICKWIFSCFD